VQHVAAVARLDRAADLDADAQHVRDGEVRAACPDRQVRLRVIRHHDVRAAVRGHVGVEDLDDVPVGQVGRDVRLRGEPAAGRFGKRRLVQHLDRHLPVRQILLVQVDLGVATRPDVLDEAVAGQVRRRDLGRLCPAHSVTS
jgi:hypothetical protein